MTGIEVSTHVSHTLYDPDALIQLNGGSVPHSMTQFEKLAQKAGKPQEPAPDPPNKLPPLPERVDSKDTAIPSLEDLGYTAKPTSPYKVSPRASHYN